MDRLSENQQLQLLTKPANLGLSCSLPTYYGTQAVIGVDSYQTCAGWIRFFFFCYPGGFLILSHELLNQYLMARPLGPFVCLNAVTAVYNSCIIQICKILMKSCFEIIRRLRFMAFLRQVTVMCKLTNTNQLLKKTPTSLLVKTCVAAICRYI